MYDEIKRLTDVLYVSYDGHSFILMTASNDLPETVIRIEPKAMQALFDYAKEVGFEYK